MFGGLNGTDHRMQMLESNPGTYSAELDSTRQRRSAARTPFDGAEPSLAPSVRPPLRDEEFRLALDVIEGGR
jgi:hypothetical protein